jgi:uncharacterized protein (DUF39 family)
VKQRVEELGPQTKDELIDVVTTAWESIELSLVNHLMESMPTRLNEVVLNQGAHRSYGTIQWKECMNDRFQTMDQWDQLFDRDSIHFD